jgi:DNA polymerase III delta prime subunit
MNNEKIGEISIGDLEDSSLARVAKSVYNSDTITEEQLMMVLSLDLEMAVKQFTISAAETRQVRQYESNNYHVSIQIDMTGSQEVVLQRVRDAANSDKLAIYAESKKTLYAIIREKYTRNENYLRELIQAQKLEDGVKT